MRIFYLFILFFSACCIGNDVSAGQMPVRSFKGRDTLRPSANPSIDEEDYEDDEGFDERMEEDKLPPIKRMSPQFKEVSSRRNGFQQKAGMKVPERLAPRPEDLDEMEDDVELPNSSESAAPMPEPAPLPPRDYPPKLPELKLGQTEWNQMDLHSLVEGRRS
jgi:hypothetical protein